MSVTPAELEELIALYAHSVRDEYAPLSVQIRIRRMRAVLDEVKMWRGRKRLMAHRTFETLEECDRLAHDLAACHATGLLQSEALAVEIDGEIWWHIGETEIPFGIMNDELRYLELRCLLRQHPTKTYLVQIVGVPA